MVLLDKVKKERIIKMKFLDQSTPFQAVFEMYKEQRVKSIFLKE